MPGLQDLDDSERERDVVAASKEDVGNVEGGVHDLTILLRCMHFTC
jgi:hypothetical protein